MGGGRGRGVQGRAGRELDRRRVCRRPRLLPRAACRDVRVEPRGRSAFGPRAGDSVRRVGDDGALFYPLFVAAVLALIVTLERPTRARQLLTVALMLARRREDAGAGVAARGCHRGGDRRPPYVFRYADGSRPSGRHGLLCPSSESSPSSPHRSGRGPDGCVRPALDTYNPLDVSRWAVWNVALRTRLRSRPPRGAAAGARPVAEERRIGPGAVARRSGYRSLDLDHRVGRRAVRKSLRARHPPRAQPFLRHTPRSHVFRLLACRRPPASALADLAIAAVARNRSPPPDAPVHERRIRRLPGQRALGRPERAPHRRTGQVVRRRSRDCRHRRVPTCAQLHCRCSASSRRSSSSMRTSPVRDHAESKALGWVDGPSPTACTQPSSTSPSTGSVPERVRQLPGRSRDLDRVLQQEREPRLRCAGRGGKRRSDDAAALHPAERRAGRSRRPVSPDYAVVDSRVRVVGTELAELNLHDFPGFDTKRHGALTLWRPEKPLSSSSRAVAHRAAGAARMPRSRRSGQ